MINRWLVRLGLWLAKRGGWQPDIPADLLDGARICVAEQQAKWAQRDGEAKRAAVYRTLINTHPHASRRLISQAIEMALCLDC